MVNPEDVGGFQKSVGRVRGQLGKMINDSNSSSSNRCPVYSSNRNANWVLNRDIWEYLTVDKPKPLFPILAIFQIMSLFSKNGMMETYSSLV